ncbi:TraR/DksA family transcriptional regulator [Patescibacteria group bacterium]
MQSQATIEVCRQKLLQVVKQGSVSTTSPDAFAGLDPAHKTVAFCTIRQTSQIAGQALEDAKAALARIKGGTFGRCSVCRGDIPEERLLRHPAADHCVGCHEEYKTEKRRQGFIY